MRRIFRTLLIAVTFVFLHSCQKELVDPLGSSNVGGTTGDFCAKVDGVQFVASMAAASRMGGLINITGQTSDGQVITMTVADSGVHVYTMEILSTTNAGAYSVNSSTSAYTTNAGSTPAESGGTLSIISIDTANKKMSGTFSFKAFRPSDATQKIISEGVFTNISYTTTLPPAASTDTFYVKIDGVDFNPTSIFGVTALNTINITANTATGTQTVALTVPSTVIPGTYTLDFFGLTYIGLYNPNSTTSLASDSGTLTILEHNTSTKRIRGNFNFHAAPLVGTTPTATLTAGYFSVKYQ